VVCKSLVFLSLTCLRRANTAERIAVLFGVDSWGPENIVLDGILIPLREDNVPYIKLITPVPTHLPDGAIFDAAITKLLSHLFCIEL